MNCKPGDLAIVIRCPARPELIGRILRVTTPCPVHPGHWDTDPPYYLHPFPFPMSFSDLSLRPLRPGEEPEAITTDEPLEVPA